MSNSSARVLLVTPQLPYPIRSGFATRVGQLARQLARSHDVTLLTYARPDQRESVIALRDQLSVEVVQRRLVSGPARRAWQLRSIISSRPFACHAVYSDDMQRAITRLCAAGAFDVVQLESSLLCAFDFPRTTPVILDEHNIESELLGRMCEGERSVVRRSFNRLQHRRYQRFERAAWRRVDACLVTSDRERPIIEAAAPGTPTTVVPNGVDLEYFTPARALAQPRTLVFNGVLDYRPNLDAAYHLVDEVWPLVLARCPNARLTIVGRGYPGDLRRLSRPSVTVTGEVPDIRPYLAEAEVSAVPVRIGGGTRLKVIEGLAMGKAMVSTSLGCEGVAVRDGEHLLIADGAAAFATRVVSLFEDPSLMARLGYAGRRLVERDYSWSLSGSRLEVLYERILARQGVSDPPRTAVTT